MYSLFERDQNIEQENNQRDSEWLFDYRFRQQKTGKPLSKNTSENTSRLTPELSRETPSAYLASNPAKLQQKHTHPNASCLFCRSECFGRDASHIFCTKCNERSLTIQKNSQET